MYLPLLIFAGLALLTWRLTRSSYNQLAHFLNTGSDNTAVTHESELERLIDSATRYYSQGKWIAAEKAYLKVLKLDHKNLPAYRRLALIYSHLHNYNDAIECLEMVMKKETTAADLQNYATMLFHIKKSEKAIIALQQALELEPTIARFTALAKLYKLQNEPQRQLEILLAAHEFDTQDQDSIKLIVRWYTENNETDQAERWRGKLIEKSS